MRWIRPVPAAKIPKMAIGSSAGPGAAVGKAPSMTAPAAPAMAPPAVKRQKGISKAPGAKATGEVSHPQSHAAFMKLGAD